MDTFDKGDVEHSFRRIQALLGCGIFNPENATNPLLQSAFIEVVICMRDLVAKINKYAKPIDFTDDVNVDEEVKDISSLITYVRNAMCHLNSDQHYLVSGKIKATFNVSFGRGGYKIGDFEQSNPYEDDFCFFFGPQRIFLKRHIWRFEREARAVLEPLMKAP